MDAAAMDLNALGSARAGSAGLRIGRRLAGFVASTFATATLMVLFC